jgi:hypothetical protein
MTISMGRVDNIFINSRELIFKMPYKAGSLNQMGAYTWLEIA